MCHRSAGLAASLVLLWAVLPGPAQAEEKLKCDDLLAADDVNAAKLMKRNSLEAACGKDLSCTTKCKKQGDERFEVVGSYDGGFDCPGKVERIVSLFPCGEGMGINGMAGVVVLLKGTASGWRRADRLNESVFPQDACRVEKAGSRNLLLCKVGWGPLQGILGETLCAVTAPRGKLKASCPLRVTTSAEGALDPSQIPVSEEIGGMQVGTEPSGESKVTVSIGKRKIVFDLSAQGLRLSKHSKAMLQKNPLPGVDVESE